jgi:Ser/Thr protein kinase RdoA (MazF antagonist)
MSLQKRIDYTGDLAPVLRMVCSDFVLGDYRSHKLVPVGYEDLNIVLTTSRKNYFVKIFASFRDERECKQYVSIMTSILDKGISHPLLYSSASPLGFLRKIELQGHSIFLCVMEYIDGKNFLQLKKKPTEKEAMFIVSQAAKINSLSLKPAPVYDSWSVTNFDREYTEKKYSLPPEDSMLITPLIQKFKELEIQKLHHCFIHGDIISINLMKDREDTIYIIDFAVSNYYPRIQEVAVLLCDLFFYPDDPGKTEEMYAFVVGEYEKYMKLTEREKKVLPVYIQFAHAMHLLRASYEKIVNGDTTSVNEYFLSIGRKGLQSQN